MAKIAGIEGQWFCDHCDTVVFLTYEKITASNICCPVCGWLACNFIPRKLSRAMIRPEWFNGMRQLVDTATGVDLFSHRQIFRRRSR